MASEKESNESRGETEVVVKLRYRLEEINVKRKRDGGNTQLRSDLKTTQVGLFLAELQVDQIIKAVQDEQWQVGKIEQLDPSDMWKGVRLSYSFDDVISSTMRYAYPNYRRLHSPLPPVLADIIDGPAEIVNIRTDRSIQKQGLGLTIDVRKSTYGKDDFYALDITEQYTGIYHARNMILEKADHAHGGIPYNPILMDEAFGFLVKNIMQFATISPQKLEEEANGRVIVFRKGRFK